jgi:hypothetical protein
VDSTTPASVKVRVSATILALAVKGVETEDIEMRVAELECAARDGQQRRVVIRSDSCACDRKANAAG